MCNPMIAVAAVSAGSSIISSNAQKSAAKSAAQTAQQTTADNNATARYIFDRQTELNEPFRQSDLARRRIGDSFFGIEAIAPQAGGGGSNAAPNVNALMGGQYSQYVQQNPDLQNAFMSLSPANSSYIASRGYDRNGDRNIDADEYGQFHYAAHGMGEGRQLPTMAANAGGPAAATLPANKQPVQDTSVPTTIPLNSATGASTVNNLFDPSLPGASNFNNSVFNPLAQTMFNQDRDRIDANLAASGLLYDGVRQTAVQEAGNRAAQNALGMYFNALNGAPMSQATNNLTTAAGNYGQSVMNNNTAGANAVMQSQLMRGQANADMWGNIGQSAAFALGGGRSGFGF